MCSRPGGAVGVVCWEGMAAVGATWDRCFLTIERGMDFLSVVLFAANAAPGCAGAGLGVMIVPASCALLYTGSERFMLYLHILAEEMDPSGDCSGLVFWDCHDESAGLWVLV